MPYFDRVLVQRYDDLTRDLEKGRLVICGQTYYYCVATNYVNAVLSDLAVLKESIEVKGYLDGKPLYKGYPLADGKYVLCHSAISDLLEDD